MAMPVITERLYVDTVVISDNNCVASNNRSRLPRVPPALTRGVPPHVWPTATLKHVARTVAHVELSDHVVDIVFTLFDDNSKCCRSARLITVSAAGLRALQGPSFTNSL